MSADAGFGKIMDNFTNRASLAIGTDKEIHDGVLRIPIEPHTSKFVATNNVYNDLSKRQVRPKISQSSNRNNRVAKLISPISSNRKQNLPSLNKLSLMPNYERPKFETLNF
jgi:hypothetical protein